VCSAVQCGVVFSMYMYLYLCVCNFIIISSSFFFSSHDKEQCFVGVLCTSDLVYIYISIYHICNLFSLVLIFHYLRLEFLSVERTKQKGTSIRTKSTSSHNLLSSFFTRSSQIYACRAISKHKISLSLVFFSLLL